MGGMVAGNLRMKQSGRYGGMVGGNAIVDSGLTVIIDAMVRGDLIVNNGADVTVTGIIGGQIVNRGGTGHVNGAVSVI